MSEYRRLSPNDRWVIDSSGNVIGVQSPTASGEDFLPVRYQTDALTGGIGFQSGSVTLPPVYSKALVASRNAIPSKFASANKQLMSRSLHRAMDDITKLQLLFANFCADVSTGETNPGAATSVTMSVEYPVGTITRATFSGSLTATVADGDNVLSDEVSVVIPKGSIFYVRIWFSNSAGIIYHINPGLNNVNGSVPESGEWCTFGVTTTDYTAVATNANNQQAGVCFKPAAIVGYTSKPTFAVFGDSRTAIGTSYDATVSPFGLAGEVDRSLGRQFATVLIGRSGEKASDVAGSSAVKRIAIANLYCTNVISNYGINDCVAGTAAATTITNLKTFAAKFNNKPVYQCTVSPKSASTDSWATTGNQTTDATANPLRVTLNGLIRAGLPAPFAGIIEVADQVESARNSGLWKVTGAANGYTSDGLHGNTSANLLIETSTAFLGVFPN